MRKKSESTIIERALDSVPGFDRVNQKLQQQMSLRGQSKSTLHNYIHGITAISQHFGRLPELIADAEINEYLAALALSAKSPSRSNFKHAVYGLHGHVVINMKLSDIDFERKKYTSTKASTNRTVLFLCPDIV